MTAIEEIVRIIHLRQQRGERTAFLSELNRQLLGHRPQPRATVTAMPNEKQRQEAVQRYRRAAVAQEAALPQPAPSGQAAAALPQPAPKPFSPADPAQRVAAAQPVRLTRPGIVRDDGTYPPAPDLSSASWEQLRECCLHCSSCRLAHMRKNVVIEDGLPSAPLMFIGEGPGADEDAQGKPFVGKAGQLLTRMIQAMGRDRDSLDPATGVYIANVVKCRPPQNRNPQMDEVHACQGYLLRQIELVKPKVIVLLGNVALEALFGQSGIMRARGNWRVFKGIPVMPTFHPAFLLRFEGTPEFISRKRQVWQDLQQVMARLSQA